MRYTFNYSTYIMIINKKIAIDDQRKSEKIFPTPGIEPGPPA